MSTISIAAYFPFRRVRISAQSVSQAADMAVIDVMPDKRLRPICHKCGQVVVENLELSEYRAACREDKAVFKGAKYLLLKKRIRKREHRRHLAKLMSLNETIFKAVLLRDKLPQIWKYKYRRPAARALDEWRDLAIAVGHPELKRFVTMLGRHREGILNHCDYPIHTSRLEGVNNKIKVIKRNAHGYHDERYFMLKVIQAFDPN